MASKGSSPRMRGSLSSSSVWQRNHGIIPAHAGLTSREKSPCRGNGDHPRACGAHTTSQSSAKRSVGSSPRMRGSQSLRPFWLFFIGIIPAHAGLTTIVSAYLLTPWDHPRACGAHLVRPLEYVLFLGSSPRMRGSHHQAGHGLLQSGIIPAHAGLTSRRRPAQMP